MTMPLHACVGTRVPASRERALRACWRPEGAARCRARSQRASDGSAGGSRPLSARACSFFSTCVSACTCAARLYKRNVHVYDVWDASPTQKAVF